MGDYYKKNKRHLDWWINNKSLWVEPIYDDNAEHELVEIIEKQGYLTANDKPRLTEELPEYKD